MQIGGFFVQFLFGHPDLNIRLILKSVTHKAANVQVSDTTGVAYRTKCRPQIIPLCLVIRKKLFYVLVFH